MAKRHWNRRPSNLPNELHPDASRLFAPLLLPEWHLTYFQAFERVWRHHRQKELSMTINGPTLSRLSPCIRRACRDDRFYVLLERQECGAFDGGCLIVAEALHQALSTGTLYGLWGHRLTRTKDRPVWMHAILRIGDRYVDGDGVAHKQLLVDRWRKQELAIVTSLQPMSAIDQQGVANGTPYAPEIIDQVAAFFCEQFRTVT